MHSHHSHSGAYCRHANPATSPKSMLQLAQQRGFTHYHLTEHIPRNQADQLYPEERQANVSVADLQSTFDAYLQEARSLQEVYLNNGLMHVLVGAETENVDGRSADCLSFVEQVLRPSPSPNDWRVDFLVGSVHHVHGIPIDFDKPTFEKCLLHMLTIDDDESKRCTSLASESERKTAAHLLLMRAYLDAQYALIDRFEPEVVGHFDLCRLFDHSIPMTTSSRPEGRGSIPPSLQTLLSTVEERVRRNVQRAVSYGALFEVNSASVRKGWPTPYPGADVVDVILEENGRFCLSDDAHAHEQVGLNYHKSYEYLRSNGVENVWVLEREDGKGTCTDAGKTTFSRNAKARPVALSDLVQFIESNR